MFLAFLLIDLRFPVLKIDVASRYIYIAGDITTKTGATWLYHGHTVGAGMTVVARTVLEPI